MKTYNINDTVWIHLGEPSLVKGVVVHVAHITPSGVNTTLYIIQIETGIDYIYEAREWEQISSTATGPLNLFLDKDLLEVNRFFKKVGTQLPTYDVAKKPRRKRRV